MPSIEAGDRTSRVIALLDLRDGLAAVANVTACLALACRAPTLPSAERHALGTVVDIARDKLDAIVASLDAMIEAENAVSPTS